MPKDKVKRKRIRPETIGPKRPRGRPTKELQDSGDILSMGNMTASAGQEMESALDTMVVAEEMLEPVYILFKSDWFLYC